MLIKFQAVLGTIISAVTGSENPQEVAVMAKQATDVSNYKVVNNKYFVPWAEYKVLILNWIKYLDKNIIHLDFQVINLLVTLVEAVGTSITS